MTFAWNGAWSDGLAKGGVVRSIVRRFGLGTYWPYFVLAGVVMGPLLARGYILTLDMVFGPQVQVPSATTASFLFYGALHIASTIVPMDIVQTSMLVAILVFTGIGMHRLVVSIRPAANTDWTVATYFAGILFVVNPFVYSRFMAGQFAVLLGYMALPYITKALIGLYKKPTMKQTVRIGLYAAIIGIVSIHTLGLVVLIAVGTGIAYGSRTHRKLLLRYAAAALLLFAILSSYWLVPFLLGNSTQSQQVAAFTPHDTSAFATDETYLGALGNVLALHGFWGDGKGLYQTPQDVYSWWIFPVVALWLLVGVGSYVVWRKSRRLACGLGGLVLVAALLAAGSQAPITGSIYAAVDYIPFFGGYREPQKFAGIIALVYALLGAWGVTAVLAYVRSYWRSTEQIAIGCLLMLPILCAPFMVWGFKGQARAADYPSGWYAANNMIGSNATVLFLPWHHYMRYDFAGRVIASPVPKFFDAHMIYSNDPELNGVGYAQTATQRAVQDDVIPRILDGGAVSGDLRRLGIDYIAVAKDYDYQRYHSLDQDHNLNQIQSDSDIIVYKVEK